jgi:hypothetical protein
MFMTYKQIFTKLHEPFQMSQEVQTQQQGVNASDFIQNLFGGGPYPSTYDAGGVCYMCLTLFQSSPLTN